MHQADKAAEHLRNVKQLIRFIVVGFSNFTVSFAVFYLLYNFWKLSTLFYALLGESGKNLEDFLLRSGAASLDATLANIAGYGAGIVNSFTWNKLWTFKARQETAIQFGRFLALNLACLLFSSACLFLFTDYLQWPYLPVWFVTMGIVTILNFLGSRMWVFRKTNSSVF